MKCKTSETGERKLGSEKKDCQTQQICKEDAMDRKKWRKLKMLYYSHKNSYD